MSTSTSTSTSTSASTSGSVSADAGTVDATLHDAARADSGHDGGKISDAAVGADSSPDGASCASVFAALLAQPIVPPAKWLGVDLSNGGAADGGPGSGGLTIDQSGLLACATFSEPATPAGSPLFPGYRVVSYSFPGDGGATPITIQYNMQSRDIYFVSLGSGDTGALHFTSRNGSEHYNVSIGTQLLQNGASFPADWNFAFGDGGVTEASAWANEVYDALMATFDPGVAPVADCLSSTMAFDSIGLPVQSADCLFMADDGLGNSILGVRHLHLYLMFNQGTNLLNGLYGFWMGGFASDCATPEAAEEAMDWAWVGMGAIDYTSDMILGNLIPGFPVSNPLGLTYAEANSILGCNGVAGTAPDPGYSLVQWGPQGEVAMEYDDAGVAYKVIGRTGYKGTFEVPATEIPDAGSTNAYDLAVGQASMNGGAFSIDWSDAAAAKAAVTAVANSCLSFWCGAPPNVDADCVAQGDCAIVPDDGAGHSSFTVQVGTYATDNFCGPMNGSLTFVFPQGRACRRRST